MGLLNAFRNFRSSGAGFVLHAGNRKFEMCKCAKEKYWRDWFANSWDRKWDQNAELLLCVTNRAEPSTGFPRNYEKFLM